MKVFISACIAFCIAVGISVFSLIYVQNSVRGIQVNIEKLPQEIEENKNTPEDALGCIDKTKETWNKKENILALFVSHRELDEIGALLETLHSAALSSDSGHYASTLAVLKERLKKLSVSEGFSAVSIL